MLIKMVRKFKYEYDDAHIVKYINYLKKLDTKKPFPCRNLRVLPEQVYCTKEGAPFFKCNAGELICLYRVRKGLSQVCHVNSDIVANGKGGLEVKCIRGVRIPIKSSKGE